MYQTHHSIALLGIAVAGWSIYWVYSKVQLERRRAAFKVQHGCLAPPGNIRPWDVFGLYALYTFLKAAAHHRLLEKLDDDYKKHGTTFSAIRNGMQIVSTCDAEVIKTILATEFEDWAVEPPRSAFHPLLGKGVFTTDGAFWHHSRSVLRPQFEKQQVSELGQFEPHVQRLIASIPSDGSTVDLQDLFHKLTMDSSSEFLTGTSTGLLDKEYNAEGHEFASAFEVGCRDGMMRARLGRFYWLVPHFKAWRAIGTSRRYAEKQVSEAIKYRHDAAEKAKSKKEYVFLRELAMDDRVDVKQMADEMLNIMLAGRDTTASLLSSLFFVLARKPEVLKKLQAEVAELNGELPTYSQLRDMKYLRYTTQEVLRLYPPVPLLPKAAIKDTILPRGGGPKRQDPMFVPRDSMIMYNTWSMMRSEAVYGLDALQFRPERWEDPNLRPGWSYLPFGGGARVCLGQQYALTQAYYVTVRLLQEFSSIENRDGQPWLEKLTATCCSLNGTKVAMFRERG